MNQEKFNNLARKYIDENKTEELWQLYLENEDMNPELIEDFYISKKDTHAICELISIKGSNMNIDRLIDKIIATKDRDFIGMVALNNLISLEISGSNFFKLKKACEEEK